MQPGKSLAQFIANVHNFPLLTVEQEIQLSKQLHIAKAERWQLLLSYKPTQAYMYAFLRTKLTDMLGSKSKLPVSRRTLQRVLVQLDSQDVAQLAKSIQNIDWDNAWWAKCYKKLSARKVPKSLLKQIQKKQMEMLSVKDRIFMGNVRFTIMQARKFSKQTDHLDIFDMIQEGYVALWHMMDKYTVTRKCRFACFINWWLLHGFSRAQANLERTIRYPVHAIDLRHKVTKAIVIGQTKTGRYPSTEELVQELGISEKNVLWAQQMPVELKLEETKDSRRVGTKLHWDLLASGGATPEDEVASRENMRVIQKLMTCLDDREKYVIIERYGLHGREEKDLKTIAKEIGKSRERVRQIEAAALHRLHYQGIGGIGSTESRRAHKSKPRF